MDSAFTSLSDFNVTALKWTDLDQDVVYQIASTRTVNTQHGQSVILSLQKADGSSCSAWACGMLSKELLQNDNGNGCLYCLLERKRARLMDESTMHINW